VVLGLGLKECGYGPDVGLGFLILLPRWSAGNVVHDAIAASTVAKKKP